jgi:hypothetical protein
MRYYQGDVERLVPKIWKKLYQRATLQVTANPQHGCLNQAKAGDTSGFVGLHAVDVQRTWQLKPRWRRADTPIRRVLRRAYVRNGLPDVSDAEDLLAI